MILRDGTGSAIGHTEVIPATDTVIHSIPTAYLPSINESDATAFAAALAATAY